MHMADALISPLVGGAMTVVSTTALGYSIKKVNISMDEKKIPLMGVMGAFVFAAQMINFTIPATGSSGHIGGGLLLAALLGPHAGFITISAILMVQALFFGDGGLLALGCNIFNLGFMTCYVAYPIFFKPLLTKGYNKKKIIFASMISVVLGLQMGSFMVVLETVFSQVTNISFNTFLLLMQPIHLAIGLVEGIITALVLCFIYEAKPELILDNNQNNKSEKINFKKILIIFISIAVVTGGVFSLFASSHPDGLEWSIEKAGGVEEKLEGIKGLLGDIQEKIAILPDYQIRDNESDLGTSLSGIVGGFITISVIVMVGVVIRIIKKKNRIT